LGIVMDSMRKADRTEIYCQDFVNVDEAPLCCTSCHDDWEEGYDDPTCFPADDKLPAPSYLCCVLRGWVDDQH
jgi:hypothetical protein